MDISAWCFCSYQMQRFAGGPFLNLVDCAAFVPKFRCGMAQRNKLKPSDLAHRLAASLHRHVRLLADPTGRYTLYVSHDARFEVAMRQAA